MSSQALAEDLLGGVYRFVNHENTQLTTLIVRVVGGDDSIQSSNIPAIVNLFMRLLSEDERGIHPLGSDRVILQVNHDRYYIRIQEVARRTER